MSKDNTKRKSDDSLQRTVVSLYVHMTMRGARIRSFVFARDTKGIAIVLFFERSMFFFLSSPKCTHNCMCVNKAIKCDD